MSAVLDELHTLVQELEAEGHAAAGRLRDVATRIKDDAEGLFGRSREEVQVLVDAVVKQLAPQVATELKALLGEIAAAAGPALEASTGDLKAALADVLAALRTL